MLDTLKRDICYLFLQVCEQERTDLHTIHKPIFRMKL